MSDQVELSLGGEVTEIGEVFRKDPEPTREESLAREIEKAEAAEKAVHSNASEDWKSRADAALDRACRENELVVSDDVWDILDEEDLSGPHDGRAMGHVMKRGAKRGSCVATEMYRKSAREGCHGHPRTVWRSLIYEGADS